MVVLEEQLLAALQLANVVIVSANLQEVLELRPYTYPLLTIPEHILVLPQYQRMDQILF